MRAVSPLLLVVAFLGIFAFVARPHTVAGPVVPGGQPDSLDYAYGAAALLHGRYTVAWKLPASQLQDADTAHMNGVPHVPQYSPGFPILLSPAVALGGVQAAVWVPYAAGLLLGVLSALLAARLAGPWAAPLAVVTVLCAVAPIAFSHLVMSEMPSVTLVMLEVLLLVTGRGPRAAALAGVVAGFLVWVRPANGVLLLAGLAGLTARRSWRYRAAAYVVGALLLLGLLALWQFIVYGSPLTTGYQAAHTNPNHDAHLGSFFGLQYALGQPHHAGNELGWKLPNALLYPLSLCGADLYLALPGIGLLGLVASLHLARQTGPLGVVSRFGLIAVATTLVVYVPYFYQDARFLMAPAAVLNVIAAVVLARWLSTRARALLRPDGETGLGHHAPG